MRKSLFTALAVAVCFTVGGMSAGAPQAGEKSLFQGDKGEVYYMIAFTAGIDYWKACFEGMREAAKQLGVSVEFAGPPNYDVNATVTVLEQTIAKKPAGITIACPEPTAFIDPINNGIADGVPIITYDSDSSDSKRFTFVSTDAESTGRGAADLMAELLGSKGDCVAIYELGLDAAEKRMNGFEKQCVDKYPGMKLINRLNSGGDTQTAAQAAAAAIQANPNLRGIVTPSGVSAVGAATAIREAGKTGKIMVVGWDRDVALLDAIKAGEVAGSIIQNTFNMGYWSMMVLYNKKHGLQNATLPMFIDVGYDMCTKENVDSHYKTFDF